MPTEAFHVWNPPSPLPPPSCPPSPSPPPPPVPSKCDGQTDISAVHIYRYYNHASPRHTLTKEPLKLLVVIMQPGYGNRVWVLCCLMAPGQGMQSVSCMTIFCSILANHKIKHQTTMDCSCQPCDCRWPFNRHWEFVRVCMLWVNILTLSP